jgi:hypothetical protein
LGYCFGVRRNHVRKDGCGPVSPQDIVYPILSEKSLHFCEKTSCNELFTKFSQ